MARRCARRCHTACSKRSSSIPAFDWSQVVVATAADIPGRNVILLIEDDQPALVAIGKPGDACRRSDRAGRGTDPRAGVYSDATREADHPAAARDVHGRGLARGEDQAVPRRQRVQAVLDPQGPRRRRRVRRGDGQGRTRDRGALLHLAAGTDVHRAAGDDGRVARRQVLHHRIDAVPVLRAQGDEGVPRLRQR